MTEHSKDFDALAKRATELGQELQLDSVKQRSREMGGIAIHEAIQELYQQMARIANREHSFAFEELPLDELDRHFIDLRYFPIRQPDDPGNVAFVEVGNRTLTYGERSLTFPDTRVSNLTLTTSNLLFALGHYPSTKQFEELDIRYGSAHLSRTHVNFKMAWLLGMPTWRTSKAKQNTTNIVLVDHPMPDLSRHLRERDVLSALEAATGPDGYIAEKDVISILDLSLDRIRKLAQTIPPTELNIWRKLSYKRVSGKISTEYRYSQECIKWVRNVLRPDDDEEDD
jgi:hypothetical protein